MFQAPVTLLFLISILSSDPVMFRGGPQLDGFSPKSLTLPLALDWQFEAGGVLRGDPIVANQTLFIGSETGSFFAVDLDKRSANWTFQAGSPIEASALVIDGAVIFGSDEGFLFALDQATGKLLWKNQAEDRILGAASWAKLKDGTRIIVVGSYDTFLYAFRMKDGKFLWKFESENYIHGTPTIAGNHVLFGGCDGFFRFLSTEDGKLAKSIDLGHYMPASAACDTTNVYFGHVGKGVAALNLGSGETIWSFQAADDGFFSSPALSENSIFIGNRDDHLYALAKKDGSLLWKFKARGAIDSSPTVFGTQVGFGSDDGRIYILDKRTGKRQWSYDLGDRISSSLRVFNNRLFVSCEDGKVYTFKSNAP